MSVHKYQCNHCEKYFYEPINKRNGDEACPHWYSSNIEEQQQ